MAKNKPGINNNGKISKRVLIAGLYSPSNLVFGEKMITKIIIMNNVNIKSMRMLGREMSSTSVPVLVFRI